MGNKVEELENKVILLEGRIKQLEKIERRRKIKKYISIGIKVIIWTIIIIWLYSKYVYIKVNYIDKYDKAINNIEEKVNGIKDFDIKNWFKKEQVES